jgi:hypothetical protein
MKKEEGLYIFRLLIKLIYSFILDRSLLKKILTHSGKEIWYIVFIIILSAVSAKIIAINITLESEKNKTKKETIKPLTEDDCFKTLNDYITGLHYDIYTLQNKNVKPKTEVIKPKPEIKDVEYMLNEIK